MPPIKLSGLDFPEPDSQDTESVNDEGDLETGQSKGAYLFPFALWKS